MRPPRPLPQVDVVASSAGAILGLGAFVGGVFGMNLPSPLFEGDPEEVGWRFQVVTASTALVMALASPTRCGPASAATRPALAPTRSEPLLKQGRANDLPTKRAPRIAARPPPRPDTAAL